MNTDNICTTCHLAGTGCCIMHSSEEDFMFGLTNFEINRIISEQKLEEKDFVVSTIISEEIFKSFYNLDKIFYNVFINRTRKRLKLVNEKCVFLSEAGCKLPVDIRPYYCRMYPFWINQNGDVTIIRSDRCLAQHKAITKSDIYEMFNTSENGIIKLYKEYYNIVQNL